MTIYWKQKVKLIFLSVLSKVLTKGWTAKEKLDFTSEVAIPAAEGDAAISSF